VRNALRNVAKKVTREVTLRALFFLPAERRRRIERWLRGREEFRRLREADCVVVSYGKSGRTWLRVLLSRYFQVRHGLGERELLGFDNLHQKNADVPRIFFTHDNYLRDYTGHLDSKRDFYGSKLVLLVRNPQDVAVSQFFQWKHRMRPAKKKLNDYPPHGADFSPFDFVMHPGAGLPKVVGFLNDWARELGRIPDVLIVRYEDMRANPEESFRRVVEFIGGPADPGHVRDAVEYASVENMRALESRRVFWRSGSRMTPRDRSNPDSYKVRRAVVGGYRDYFEDDELKQIDELVRSRLDPVFGYGGGKGAA
jgi:hypothetical protein